MHEYLAMRTALGLALLLVGLFLLGGPAFAVIVALSGDEFYVRGGGARVVVDVVLGVGSVMLGLRRLQSTAHA